VIRSELGFSPLAWWIPFALGLLLVFVPFFESRVARADPPTAKTVAVYVLTIWTEDADDQADALTKALRLRVLQAPGWSLIEAAQSFETLAIALKCPPSPDGACLQRIGDQLRADHYVWGIMEKNKATPGGVRAELHLWTRGKPSVTAHAAFSDGLKDPSDASLRAIATELFGQLTGADAASVATPIPPRAEPAVAPLPAPEPPAVASSVSSASATGRGFPAQMAIGYTALALGAGALVVSGIEAARWVGDSNDSTNDRQSIPRSVTDVCAEMTRPLAVDACSKSKDAVSASTLAWVFAGVGAALAGTGAWLIAADHAPTRTANGEVAGDASKPRVALWPSIGPRAGTLDVRITF